MCRSSNYTTFCKQNVSSADRFQHNPKVMRLLISSRHCPNKVFHRSSELLCPVKFMTISIPVLPLFRNPLRPQQFWAGKLFNVPNHAILIPLGYMLYSKTRIIHSSFSPLIFFLLLLSQSAVCKRWADRKRASWAARTPRLAGGPGKFRSGGRPSLASPAHTGAAGPSSTTTGSPRPVIV